MIEPILERLQKVKQTKPGQWVACCPAHNDKSPSLAIKQSDSGKILIKCWAGCAIHDIMSAIGMELQDLFPDQVEYKRESRDYFSAETVLKSLHKEAIIMRFLANQLKQGIPLNPEDFKRAEVAEDRIHNACLYVEKKGG